MNADLDFEVEMFLSKLSLLEAKSEVVHLEQTINKKRTRENLYEFLKDDLIFFLQKVLSGAEISDSFPDTSTIHKDIIQILKELGVYVYYPVGKDFDKTSIIERWYRQLSKISVLTLPKIINFFNIYRNRLYSLTEKCPYEFSDLNRIVRKMLSSEDYEITFEEIYNAEHTLREEILFSLLRQISPNNRLEYLVGKEIVVDLSDQFIKILHQEFSEELKKDLNEKKIVADEIIKEKESIDTEFKLAKKLQTKTLQKLPESDSRIKFSLWYSPLMHVGGDYYSVNQLDTHEYSLFLADISGHGISAAMLLNTVKISFEQYLTYKDRPEKLIRKMNDDLYGKIGDNFVTAIYIYINLKKKIIRYCNAGHPKAFLYPLTENRPKVRFLRQTGKVIGIFQKANFRDEELKLKEKERLVIYTDGIPETFNKNNQMFGERGLLRAFSNSNLIDGEEAIEKVKENLKNFQGDSPIEDDRCLILCDMNLSETPLK
ncbi:MAG: serine/threonine-protein phosphatase [Leptospiraceae bacterium]|nr:serine/threonine-protein phosphatase [Leptospiraceae bacterium]